MIKYIKLTHLRNSELLEFLKTIVNRCKRFDLIALLLTEVVNPLATVVNKLEEVYNRDQGSDLTDMLANLDDIRDKTITGIKLYCEAMMYRKEEAIVNAASLVYDSIIKQGASIARMSYPAETTAINAVIKDWQTSKKLQNALTTLNLNNWAAELETDNNNFTTTYQERVDEKIQKEVDSFSDLRADAMNNYKAVCDTIFAYSITRKMDEYKQMAEAFNVIVVDFDALIKKRSASDKTDEAAN